MIHDDNGADLAGWDELATDEDWLDNLFPANVTIACIVGAFVLAVGGAVWALVR